MVKSEEIINAIGSHGNWKKGFRRVIETVSGDVTIEQIKNDHQCDFGTWLHSLSADDKNSSHWCTIQQLHSKFHIEAARLLELAAQRRQKEAENAMAVGSSFAILSCDLTMAMVEWNNSLKYTVNPTGR
jgi:hypothetical protein